MTSPDTRSTYRKTKQALGRILYAHPPFGRRCMDLLRFEMESMGHRCLNALSPRHHRTVHDLQGKKHLSLNVGSGGQGLPGWINVDIRKFPGTTFVWDIRRRLPLSDGSVDRIMAEHVIEHLDFHANVPDVLKEFRRMLSTGGVVRIVVPDAARFIEAYYRKDEELWRALGFGSLPSDMDTWMEMVNHVFHQSGEHFFGWDMETMEVQLRKAGFHEISRMDYLKSWDPELAIDQPNHAPYSLYVEAR